VQYFHDDKRSINEKQAMYLSSVPAELRALFENEQVRNVVMGEAAEIGKKVGDPLVEETIRRCASLSS
jgi:hypothetical protein